jgi:phospholipid-binding lipoprotein MlaA
MKYTITFLSLVLLLSATGCSTVSRNAPLESPKTHSMEYTDTNNTDMLLDENNTVDDEFEDEFESQEIETIIDPISGYNRFMTSFNNGLFLYVLTPVSEFYHVLLPEVVRLGVSRFVHNIKFPIRFTNNLLQGKFIYASDELGRFLINSTLGVVGIFDPANKYFQLNAHNEDFGQTLGYYGVGSGFHIVLPFLGPSNIRDLVGLAVDGYTSPLVYQTNLEKYRLPANTIQSMGIYGLETVNQTSLRLGAYESIKKDATDLYPFLRDIYEQKRISEIEE